MTRLSNNSVIHALLSLKETSSRGEPKPIAITAIVSRTGKTAVEVKAVLAENEHALLRDKKGRLIGASILRAASQKGLIVQEVSGRDAIAFLQDGTTIRKFSTQTN